MASPMRASRSIATLFAGLVCTVEHLISVLTQQHHHASLHLQSCHQRDMLDVRFASTRPWSFLPHAQSRAPLL
eukprot:1656218-Rhodomonas_salina.1